MASDEDADVFEITDFTTASDWERFIARLEEVLHEWKLVNNKPKAPAAKNEFTTGEWLEKTDDICFADFKFLITYHYLNISGSKSESLDRQSPDNDVEEEEKKEDETPTVLTDLMSTDNDFPSKAHCLVRLYGLQEFIVITPADRNKAIDSESRAKVLLSSVSVALTNSSSSIPVFIQIQQPWRQMYCGTSVMSEMSVEFDVIHLTRIPQQYSHLAGLLDVFKSKLATQVTPRPTVDVAVRFTYQLQEWVNSPWPQEPPDLSSPMEDEIGCSSFGSLPFGAIEDPISALQLFCSWYSLSEDMIVENQNYSDLDPLLAPQWTAKINKTEDPRCLLGTYIHKFLKHCYSKETTRDLLWNILSDEEENDATADISHALHRLTENKVGYNIPSLSNVVSKAGSRLAVKQAEAPISHDTINDILLFLFPDAKDPLEKANDEREEENTCENNNPSKFTALLESLPKRLKTAPTDSLVYRLAVCLCIVNKHNGGLKGLAQMWQEFVLEMRYRWENKYEIEGINKSAPHLGSCLLYQKLQMLNSCIEKKIQRETLFKGYTSKKNIDSNSSEMEVENNCALNDKSESENRKRKEGFSNKSERKKSDSSGDDDDEFYECQDSPSKSPTELDKDVDEKEDSSETMDTSLSESSSFVDSVTHKPEGRLSAFNDIQLLSTGEQLYIPVTQEPAPMTEDMLEEHAEILAKLGTSAEGAQLRARMQSACLISDMESFKAANPGCVIEDFVRWYSPRDWIEEESTGSNDNSQTKQKGYLSPRMQIPGNVWYEAWQSAKPVPAYRQKRLFDDTKEAEKVLHFLSAMKPADVILQLMPCLIHAAIIKVVENDDSDIPRLKDILDQVITRASKVTRAFNQNAKHYEDLLRMITTLENMIAQAKSLRTKFTTDFLNDSDKEEELSQFLTQLLQKPEVDIEGASQGTVGSCLHQLFIAQQKEVNMIGEEESLSENKNSAISDFPQPSAREYILRTMAPRPAPYSKTLPQKMFCSIMVGHHFQLAGAFTSDSLFQ
ncbi:rab3 GTPase-activating protein catalytic subunit-like isoform X3 [Mytilus galloprovincialis]|uniref:rab3 GTPase-activating protein catalytic subunit-like isoform X1 n=1 Tax=Mytilus galloprovincialis TaxID=29158 RepID=UPI003F7C5990